MKKIALVVCALSVLGAIGVLSPANAVVEFRALWIDGWHSGMWTQAEIDTMIGLAYGANYNVIVPQIRKKGDALYNSTYGGPSGTGEPKPSQVQPPSFDPLAYMIQEAHERGMEVHPWICTHRVPTLTTDWFYTSHEDWLTKDQAGTIIYSEGYYLDPGVPDGEEYTVNLVLDIVSNYDIDGIQFDRIRYPQENSGYNSIAISRFLSEYGYTPSYTNTAFKVWRRKQLTDFVNRVYAQIMEIKPHIAVAANTFSDWNDAYNYRFQDWEAWMGYDRYTLTNVNHALDVNVPMIYTSSTATFESRLRDALNRRHGRYVYPGMNCGTAGLATGVQQLQKACQVQSEAQYQPHPCGAQTYSYYHATVTAPGWFDYVRTNYYTSWASIPAYSWKTTPTKGIILGRVVNAAHPTSPPYYDWVYKATVTLSHAGMSNRVAYTDQTGYYVFTDVDPVAVGDGYTVTVTKSGLTSRAYTNQAVAAGQALREDFELGTTTASSPAGTLDPAWGLVSVPLEPVNPDPANVFAGIDIDARLYRFDRATQSMILYDVWTPDVFGNVSTDEGYWLQVDATKTISYSARAGQPSTHATPLPEAGWSIIGCPFLTNRQWADTLVTNGGSTVPISTARGNGWISGTGYWFDSSTQSMIDFGLPEDFPSTTELRPWHGHWVQSYVNNLTLTLR
jgi:uncharacterized lipoprotein YddW (UPF0748 family)